MPNFTVDQIRGIMDHPDQIRNMSVIAHVDHGKSTLTDSLIARAGIISAKHSGDTRYMDTRADEQERGVTIKSTGVSLYFEHETESSEGKKLGHLINLIDSPGHVDFSCEVSAALRVTDGALVVVDAIDGCAVQTETVLRQALGERVIPTLFVNKIDRCIQELQLDGEGIYVRCRTAIENVNVIISTYNNDDFGDKQVYPEKGTVSFGSGLHGWAFNVARFADIYAQKFGVEREKMMKRLWGNTYFNAKEKKWTPDASQGKRAFCQFIMDPIAQLITAIMKEEKEKYEKMFKSLNIVLKGEHRDLVGKKLMKHAMQVWINAADTLLSMIITQLPSPKKAQPYRCAVLYEGPMDDLSAQGIKACDPEGPLVLFISKMVPATDKGRFYAFGRVFSGTVRTGQKVRIQGPNFVPGSRTDVEEKSIQRCVLMMGRIVESITDVPCGNTIGLVGLDKSIVKSATITADHAEAHNIRPMKFSVHPVVEVAVKVKNVKDLSKLIEALQKLSKSDPLVLIKKNEAGENVICGCGELHVEICLQDLKNDYLGGTVEIIYSEPVVGYRETVTQESSIECLAKSPNTHNRLYVKAQPLDEGLPEAIEEGKVSMMHDIKERRKYLSENFSWQRHTIEKIWHLAPDQTGPNMFVDQTQGIAYLHEIKDHINNGFQIAASNGPLCEEPMRGIRFNLNDVTLHADSIHRGAGQILPATRRVCYAAELTGAPTLQEPIFLVEIVCPQQAMSGVYQALNLRRGCLIEEVPRPGTPQVICKAHLPVAESFGFNKSLASATGGTAFQQSIFSHWSTLDHGDPLEDGTRMNKKILEIRKRRNIKVEVPKLSEYYDKL